MSINGNQKALKAYQYMVNDNTTGMYGTHIADKFGVNRRLMSYFNTITELCTEKEFEIVEKNINEGTPFSMTSGENTRSIEVLATLLKKGDKIVVSNSVPCVVYLLESDNKTKIGIAKSISSRIKMMQSGNPYPISLVYQHRFPSEKMAREVERTLHAHWKGFQLQGEWFNLTKEQIEETKKIVERFVNGK